MSSTMPSSTLVRLGTPRPKSGGLNVASTSVSTPKRQLSDPSSGTDGTPKPKEGTPSRKIVPFFIIPKVVDIEVEGCSERIGVLESMPLLDKETLAQLDLSLNSEMDETGPSTCPASASIPSKKRRRQGKAGKAGNRSKDMKAHSRSTPSLSSSIHGSDSGFEHSQSSSSCTPLSQLPEPKFRIIDDYVPVEVPPLPSGYVRHAESPQWLIDVTEYDLDEGDFAWLEIVNEKRKELNFDEIEPDTMELLMDRIEKESDNQLKKSGLEQSATIDDDAVCCICLDGEVQNCNAILFCDICNMAVHQDCYGVPYIPEGQWLCRKCLQSPTRAVDCAYCPNKGGALKETKDGKWAHVVCALWIPELYFANMAFREPVSQFGPIPPIRWRLTCFICKQKGVGACLQCSKSKCYVAFHATCAQEAQFCMKVDTVRGATVNTIFCDNHAPPDYLLGRKLGLPCSSPKQKMRMARQSLAKKREAAPVISVPSIPADRISQISRQVTILYDKQEFLRMLAAYWKLKRISANGVPLLKRLQVTAPSSSNPNPTAMDPTGAKSDDSEAAESIEYYKFWIKLRQGLEKARLLCELVQKREKAKQQMIQIHKRTTDLRLRPLNMVYLNVMDQLRANDPKKIFHEPVNTALVQDYLTIVQQPMDISTMTEKVHSFRYSSIYELRNDFELMIRNCLAYNEDESPYAKAALRLSEFGETVFTEAKIFIESVGFDPKSGCLVERADSDSNSTGLKDAQVVQEIESVLEDKTRSELPFDKHIEKLEKTLNASLSVKNNFTRKLQFSRVKQEILRIRGLETARTDAYKSADETAVAVETDTEVPNPKASTCPDKACRSGSRRSGRCLSLRAIALPVPEPAATASSIPSQVSIPEVKPEPDLSNTVVEKDGAGREMDQCVRTRSAGLTSTTRIGTQGRRTKSLKTKSGGSLLASWRELPRRRCTSKK